MKTFSAVYGGSVYKIRQYFHTEPYLEVTACILFNKNKEEIKRDKPENALSIHYLLIALLYFAFQQIVQESTDGYTLIFIVTPKRENQH